MKCSWESAGLYHLLDYIIVFVILGLRVSVKYIYI